jgi:hypothetical protein
LPSPVPIFRVGRQACDNPGFAMRRTIHE